MNTLFEKLEMMRLRPKGDPNERLPVSSDDVESLQAFFGYPFPPLYAQFQQRYGACYFHRAYAFFKVPDNWAERSDNAGSCIFGLEGLDMDNEHTYSGFRSRITGVRASGVPDYFLPLCNTDDDESVTVFLSCREADFGHVYALTTPQFWKLDERSLRTEDVPDSAIHLADSFEEFLDGIEVVSPQEMAVAFEGPRQRSPLFEAMHAGDVAYLQKIVDAGEVASYRDQHGFSLLQCAVISRLDWPVEFLLQHKAPLDGALWTAMNNEVVGAVRLLLAYGADANQPYRGAGYTNYPINDGREYWMFPLIAAVRCLEYDKKYELARLLVAAGADATLPDSLGKTAWDYVHPRNQVMRGILKESVPVAPAQRSKYLLTFTYQAQLETPATEATPHVSPDQLPLFDR